MKETTISRMLEAITGEYLGDKNRIVVWVPDKAGNTAIAWVTFDPKTRKWMVKYNNAAPQGIVDEFKKSGPEEHIKAMIRMASSGEYDGNDGKYDFIFSGGKIQTKNPD